MNHYQLINNLNITLNIKHKSYKMKRNLPIYNIEISEKEEMFVDMVSIVESPAMEANFLSFSKNKPKLAFSDNEKKELLGVALTPDKPIYRNIDGEEFYVVFSKETIREIVQVLFKKGLSASMNIEHSDVDANSYIFQSFIVDKSQGISAPTKLGDVVDGSWVIGVKVDDEQLWRDIKSGKKNGFSVEGLFKLVGIDKPEYEDEGEDEDVIEALSEFMRVYSKVQKYM